MTEIEQFTARTPAPVAPPTPAERIELGRSESQIDLDVAHEVATSDMLPAAYKGKAVETARANLIVVFGLGRSLGVERMAALYGFHVIENTPSPSAKLQAALVRRAGHKLRTLERTDTVASLSIIRADDPDYPTTVTYTLEDATDAGLRDCWVVDWSNKVGNRPTQWDLPRGMGIHATNAELEAAGAPDWVLKSPRAERKRKDNWWTNTRTMLWHRAVTEAVGAACPEVLSGLDFDYEPDPIRPPAAPHMADPVDIIREPAWDPDRDDDPEDAELIDDAELVEPDPPKLTADEIQANLTELRKMIAAADLEPRDILKANPGKTLESIAADPALLDKVAESLEGPAEGEEPF